MDFSSIEVKTVKEFKGYLINPYHYKIKNIRNFSNALFDKFNGYIDGLQLEDCSYTPSTDLCILYNENVEDSGIIKNIQMKNCNIEVSEDCTETVKIKLGSNSFISKCSFEGMVISKNAPVEFYFYGKESKNEESIEPSMIKNSYCILEATDAKSLKYILPVSFMYSTYHVLSGTVELDCWTLKTLDNRKFNYCNVNNIEPPFTSENKDFYSAFQYMSIENMKNKGLVLDIWAPDTVMESYRIFQEFTHEEGRLPYLS